MRGLALRRALSRGRARAAALVAAAGLGISLIGGCVYNTPAIGMGASFNAVATISGIDAWAVGTWQDRRQHGHPVIEHFDGHAWTIAYAPGASGDLHAITALSATNIYALGYPNTFHWNGSRWGAITDTNGWVLNAITHDASGHLMALGWHSPSFVSQVLTHTSSGWGPLSTPTPPLPPSQPTCDASLSLGSIAMTSPNDVWVSGSTGNNPPKYPCPYAAHWDGAHWTVTPLPPRPAVPNDTGNGGIGLGSLSMRGSHDVWALESSTSFAGPDDRFTSQHGYAMRWDGTSWRTLCNVGCGPDWSSIDATGNAVWAVGSDVFPQDPFTPVQMEIDRWAGNGWVKQKVLTAPTIPTTPVYALSAVSAHGATVISVGSFTRDASKIGQFPLVNVRPDR